MANYKKKNNKNQNLKKSSSKKSPARQNLNSKNREITGIVIIAVGVLLFVSVFLVRDGGALGAIGGFFAQLMGICAGRAAIIFPVFLLVFGALVFADRYTGIWNGRLCGLTIVLLSVLSLLHMQLPFAAWTPYMAQALLGEGGGILGGFLTFFLRTAFGQILSTIILCFILLIGVLLLTQISLKSFIGSIYHSIVKFFVGLKPTDEELKERSDKKLAQEKEQQQNAKLKASLYDKEKHAELEKIKQKKEIEKSVENNELKTSARIFITDDFKKNSMPPIVEAVEAGNHLLPDKNSFTKAYLPDISAPNDFTESGSANKEEIIYKKEPESLPSLQDAAEDALPQDVLFGINEKMPTEYILPQPELLTMPVNIKNPRMEKAITDSVGLLEKTLSNFGVKATVTQVVAGPAVTRYELQPAPGVKVSRIVSLTDDIALSLAASDVRIEAPIPGRSVVGIEVPREEASTVFFREVIESEEFKNSKSKISFALGKDISGKYIVGDLAKMPHLLVAGATGMGKSVCINSFICSILYKAKPNEVKFLLIDPKKVEMTSYAGLPHLNSPVVTDVKKASASLKWVVVEMENRYDLFASAGVRNFADYNNENPEKLICHIVVIIDELADLMMTSREDVEQSICRLAQMARAAGIHLVIATQRPSVDVLTGLIKANIPSRIAFAVSSGTDSRTIIDMVGAERLIGKGDMLYAPVGLPKPIRVQGTYISDKDVEQLVSFCKAQAKPQYCEAAELIISNAEKQGSGSHLERGADDKDPLFYDAARLIITTGQASTSYLQRRFSIGNPRAGRLIDCLADNNVVSGPDGAKPRNILMTIEEFEQQFGMGE